MNALVNRPLRYVALILSVVALSVSGLSVVYSQGCNNKSAPQTLCPIGPHLLCADQTELACPGAIEKDPANSTSTWDCTDTVANKNCTDNLFTTFCYNQSVCIWDDMNDVCRPNIATTQIFRDFAATTMNCGP